MNRHSNKSLVLAIALVVISGGSLHLQAQKSQRTRSRTTKAAATQKNSIVLARAGDSLKSIAERTGANATQLARLNGLALNSKLKPGQQ
jgi:LysM repeat protein